MAQGTASLLVFPVTHPVDITSAAARLHDRVKPAVLHSAAVDDRYGRYTVIVADPVDTFEWPLDSTWPVRLRNALQRWPSVSTPGEVPFGGGWIGYITYEAGAILERVIPRHPCLYPVPEVCFNLYDHAYIFDHVRGQGFGIAVEWTDALLGDRKMTAARSRLDGLLARLCDLSPIEKDTSAVALTTIPVMSPGRAEFISAINEAKEHISAGNIYQLNLALEFTAQSEAPSSELFQRLSERNPARYAAWLDYGAYSVISSSPELFLQLNGDRVITRPIKGTRPRVGDAPADAVQRRELMASEKERAELNMIIDLLRNDLGRVCEYGSIKVEQSAELEEHPTVFHNVATVAGRLCEDRDRVDLLVATLPGGSITGCPKIRAMQIINELETFRRGVYCGCIGWLGLDGSMTLSIAIRTMWLHAQQLRFWAGSGIVADSDPEAEYAETIHKARGMLSALGHEPADGRG